MASLQEIIDRSEVLASGVATDSSASALVDSEITAALLVPHAFRFIVRKRLADGKPEDVLFDFNISVDANGKGSLPGAVLSEKLKDHAYLPDYAMSSWVSFPNFGRYKYSSSGQLQYFTSKGADFYCAPMTSARVTLRAPAVPDFDTIDGDDIPDTLADDVIGCVASVLRGETPITVVIDGYEPVFRRR